jgi:excisionase family DNA binding protein
MINGHTVNYYTTGQAAEILGVTGSNVYLLMKSGALKDVSVAGANKRIDATSVHTLAEQRRVKREQLLAQKEAAMRRKQAQAVKPVARTLPRAQPADDVLMLQHIGQTQQVIDLLTKLVGVWCPAGARQ